jgi:hypothetical protein
MRGTSVWSPLVEPAPAQRVVALDTAVPMRNESGDCFYVTGPIFFQSRSRSTRLEVGAPRAREELTLPRRLCPVVISCSSVVGDFVTPPIRSHWLGRATDRT